MLLINISGTVHNMTSHFVQIKERSSWFGLNSLWVLEAMLKQKPYILGVAKNNRKSLQ